MEVEYQDRLRKADWAVVPVDLPVAQAMVREHHYAHGGSNTAVYVDGLVRREDGAVMGIAWWLPPTRVACESVNRERWKEVLSLTRMVILPGVPKNAASFLLARSVRRIFADGRFCSLVSYACESQGHEGRVYRACNWDYVGRTGPYPRWVDPSDGKQVAPKSTKNRVKDEMIRLGYVRQGSFYKHKYVMHA